MNPPASETVCPLCGDTNECGVAAGKTTCWCFATPIPAEVLARVPEDQRNRACICARCASGGEKRPPHGIIALLIACVWLTSVTLSAQAERGVVTGVCTIDTEHAAHVVAVLKNTPAGAVPMTRVTFLQEQAGEWVEDGRIHRGQFAPYRAGEEFIAMLRRDEAGRLIELVGPHLM